MKNNSFIHLWETGLKLSLFITNNIKKGLTISSEYNGAESVAYIQQMGDNKVSICCHYTPKNSDKSYILFNIQYQVVKNGSYEFSVDFPESDPSTWAPLTKPFNLSEVTDKKHTHYSSYMLKPCYSFGLGKNPITVNVQHFFSKKEARQIWKNIKKNKYVSKFYWDSHFGVYDCYCKACEVKSDNKHYQSWVGNPDTGYVREVGFKCVKDDGIFKYRGKLYEPCNAKEYDNLAFLNRKDYNKLLVESGNNYPTFDALWKNKLTQDDINNNGNVEGGAWKQGDLIISNDSMNRVLDAEKVVTLGWHKTEPKNAVFCPVCDDLNNIICRSMYRPLPMYCRIQEFFTDVFRQLIYIFKG